MEAAPIQAPGRAPKTHGLRHGRARRRPEAACVRGEEQHVEEHGRDLGLEGGAPRARPAPKSRRVEGLS